VPILLQQIGSFAAILLKKRGEKVNVDIFIPLVASQLGRQQIHRVYK